MYYYESIRIYKRMQLKFNSYVYVLHIYIVKLIVNNRFAFYGGDKRMMNFDHQRKLTLTLASIIVFQFFLSTSTLPFMSVIRSCVGR